MLQDIATPAPDRLQSAAGLALACEGPPRMWPAELRARFASEHRHKAKRALPQQLAIGLVIAWAAGLVNVLAVPEFGWLGLILPGAFASFFTVLAFGMLRRDKIGWSKFFTACSLIGFACICMHIASHAQIEVGVRYAMATAIILPSALQGLPFTIREKGRFGLVFVLANILAGMIPHGFSPSSMMQHFVILVLIGIGSWVLVKQLSRWEAREFLQSLRAEFHRIELEQSNALLRELSESDPLTGLANRRSFERVFHEQFVAGKANRVAVMMIDIDNFKDFNDAYGHQVGDHCLVKVARELDRRIASFGGHVARFGGEEFVALLPDTTECQPSAVAHDILSAIRKLEIVVTPEVTEQITVSIGLAKGAPSTGMNCLIERADQALYNAKEMGRNRVEMYFVARDAR